MEEVNVVAPAQPMQATATIRVSSLRDEELPKGAYDPPPEGPSSAAGANVLGPEAERLLPAVVHQTELNSFLLIKPGDQHENQSTLFHPFVKPTVPFHSTIVNIL